MIVRPVHPEPVERRLAPRPGPDLRGYALAIILGIVAAIWIGERRWQARGGRPGEVQDLAVWAVPFGLVGGRLYHVATDHERYFGAAGDPWQILYVWRGGLGVWGSIAFGAVGAIIAARRRGMRIGPMVDALAPGLLVAQAIGRWGNWFNQELFGKPTDLPWALEIDPVHRPPGYESDATFHPTFLYECIWNLGMFGVLIALDRRFKFGHGRMLALYVMAYTLGPRVDRDAPDRHRGAERRVRTPLQRLDLDRAVRRGRHLLRRQPARSGPARRSRSTTRGAAPSPCAAAEGRRCGRRGGCPRPGNEIRARLLCLIG